MWGNMWVYLTLLNKMNQSQLLIRGSYTFEKGFHFLMNL